MDRNCFNKDRSKKLLITAFTAKPRSRTSHHSLTFKVSWHNSSITALSVNPRNVYTVQYFAGKMPDCLCTLNMYLWHKIYALVKGDCLKIFEVRFFHESAFHWPLSIPFWLFRIVTKIHGDIRNSPVSTISAIYYRRCRCYRRQIFPVVVDTGN
jgi:hypothetical protein